jgi:transposase
MEAMIGRQVIVRWADGLRYYGRVTKIDHRTQRYFVEFGPETSYPVLFKDVKEVSSDEDVPRALENDLLCEMCNSGVSHKPNEIVICDKCGRGTYVEWSFLYFFRLLVCFQDIISGAINQE